MQEEIKKLFSPIEDPRVVGRCDHKLIDILFIAFCTLLSNGEDFEDMVEFAEQRIDWLREILELPNGIPSHDTFNRVLQLIKPEEFTKILAVDASFLLESVKGRLISFDGKKIKGVSPKSRGNSGLYILSAWVNEARLCIGQKKVDDKSNEITAIPQLIDSLELEGSVVSIDAIGCQIEIADKIIDAKADFLLAVKANQGDLHEEVSDFFNWKDVEAVHDSWEYDHGRFETRTCRIKSASNVLSPKMRGRWNKVRTVIEIVAERTEKDIKSSNTRYYISSEEKSAEYYNRIVRGHWGIENHLHWHLDVTFNEDKSRSRKGNAPLNLNSLRKMALQRISRMKDKLSLKKRRYRASMNPEYLYKVLGFQF